MKNATEMKNKCGWDAVGVLNEAEYQAGSGGDHNVQIDQYWEQEVTVITFKNGSNIIINGSDVKYFEDPMI